MSLLFSECFDNFNRKKNLNHLFVKTLLRWSTFVESEIEKEKKTPSWQWEHTPLFFLKFTFLWSNQNFSLWMRHKELLVFKFTNVCFLSFFLLSFCRLYFLFTLLERFAFNAELLLIFHGKLLLLQLCVIRNVRLNAYTIFAVDDDFFFEIFSLGFFFAYS